MDRLRAVVAILAIVVVAESAIIALPLIGSIGGGASEHPVGSPETYTFGYRLFNQPVTNNTDHEFRTSYNGSWSITIQSSLLASSRTSLTEAELAFAPSNPVESKSIPTIIVQERADGLLRVEYFAQSWPNTYGLILYNSTTPGWEGGRNLTLRFSSFGPPSAIDPAVAPRSNGNLTITIGDNVVLSDYPIAWASLAEVYLYGLPGSSYINGEITLTVQGFARS